MEEVPEDYIYFLFHVGIEFQGEGQTAAQIHKLWSSKLHDLPERVFVI